MNILQGVARVITQSAEATAVAAGAVGGAAVNGVIGGVQGTVSGVKNGVSSGSHSTPAAALALAGIGAAGLVEWPILVGIGGAVLVLRQLNQRSTTENDPTLAVVSDTAPSQPKPAAKPTSARKSTAKKAPPRRAVARNRRAAAKR